MKRYIIVVLAIGLLAFGATKTWAAEEFNALREYELFKFTVLEADSWSQDVKGNQLVEYVCEDSIDGCVVEVLGVKVGGGVVINIGYDCDFGAKLILLPSGVLLIPNECDGAVI